MVVFPIFFGLAGGRNMDVSHYNYHSEEPKDHHIINCKENTPISDYYQGSNIEIIQNRA